MQVIVTPDYDALSRRAAALFLERVATGTRPLVVLPTGNTPQGMYRVLRESRTDLSRVRVALLDEYAGIGADDWRSFHQWLRRVVLDPTGVPDSEVIHFDPQATDPPAEAARVDQAVADAGGIDVLVLGLGVNGHLGFNEPGSAFDSPSRLVELTPESVEANAEYWGDASLVPGRAFTLGLGTLARARHTLLLVSGAAKADVLAATLDGPVTPQIPATLLQGMPDVIVVADRAALARLPTGSTS